MQNAYTREQLRIIENLSLPALDRYNNFLLKYPHIAQQVTQKQIASYLGITPEFLSAIRKNNSKKHIS
jgi:transcriptional regulator with XRE-family HTH domain